eukprot:GDKI01029990.1.p2 GENE.GDKI01029990.1~~GDKI01029990.1.p2  ORF type:complete len:136 (-),score=37.55 GDKI01029990.1:241-648(-)
MRTKRVCAQACSCTHRITLNHTLTQRHKTHIHTHTTRTHRQAHSRRVLPARQVKTHRARGFGRKIGMRREQRPSAIRIRTRAHTFLFCAFYTRTAATHATHAQTRMRTHTHAHTNTNINVVYGQVAATNRERKTH